MVRFVLVCSILVGLAGSARAETNSKGLVVIAPRDYHGALQEFIRYKQKLLPTRLVSLQDVLSKTAGADDPEKIKRWLFDAWKKDDIGYALLVGDGDVFPWRYMVLDRVTAPAFDYAFYPSDLYYADLAKADGTFDNWNQQADGFHGRYFGEVRGEKNKNDSINYDGIDYRPEIAVGRWPVNTALEANRVASKSMSTERLFRSGKHPGYQKAAAFAVGGWVDSRPHLDRVAASLPSSWTAEKRYYSDNRRKDQTPPPNYEQLKPLLTGGVQILFHAGHGTEHQWEQCFDAKHIDGLKNADRLPIMISAGCSTATCGPMAPYAPYVDDQGQEHKGTNAGEVFTEPPPPPHPYQKGKYNPTGLGEQLLRRGPNGAAAYIGCNTGSQPCGLTLLEGFALGIKNQPSPVLGDAWCFALKHYHDRERLEILKPNADWYPPSIFFQGMKFMLFGDPSLALSADIKE